MSTDLERRLEAAEKTVHVLKQQVRRLFDEGAQTAIHRQAEGAKRRAEKSQRKRAIMEARAEELLRHSERLEQQVADRTRDIRIILDNVTFGFLLVNADMTVRPGFTRSCAALFDRDVQAGDTLGELLQIGGTGVEFELQLGLDQVFDDFMPEEVTLDQLPDRFLVAERVLKIEGSTVRTDAGEVEAVLLTVSDITDLEAAQRESRRNAVLLSLLRQRTAFREFLDDTRQLLHVARGNVEDTVLVRRIVHTIKGNSGSFGLDSVMAVAHAIEEEAVIDHTALDDLEGSVRQFLNENRAMLGIEYEDGSSASVQLDADALSELLSIVTGTRAEPGVRGWVESVSLVHAEDFLRPLNGLVERLAERMGKPVELELRGNDVAVERELLRPVFRNLPHLLRNALDHGLEEPGERGEKGEVGHLSVEVQDGERCWTISVQDDGRGIDREALKTKALESGFRTGEQLASMSDDEVLELIFEDGLSTAMAVSDVSGRGVGMPAMRAAVLDSGGTLSVSSELGRGTSVRIEVPKVPVKAQAQSQAPQPVA